MSNFTRPPAEPGVSQLDYDMALATSQHPLVSVIVPAYNGEKFIRQALDSVLAQTYPHFEVVVVDDGSQDRTAEIVASLAQQDNRVSLLRQANQGVAAARNLAIERSHGEFVAPLDADDIWYPEKLEKQVKCLVQSEAIIGLVYAWSVAIDETGSLLEEGYTYNGAQGQVLRTLISHNFVGNASVPLIRRSSLDQVGYYNCELREQNAQGCEDYDLLFRIAQRFEFRVVPQFLVGYRQVQESMSMDLGRMARSYALVLADVQKRHSEIPGKVYRHASAFFHLYLSAKSSEAQNHWTALGLLFKAFSKDVSLAARSDLRQMIVLSLLKAFSKPIISKSPNSRFGRRLQRRFGPKPRAEKNRQEISISDILRKIQQ